METWPGGGSMAGIMVLFAISQNRATHGSATTAVVAEATALRSLRGQDGEESGSNNPNRETQNSTGVILVERLITICRVALH